MSISGPQSGAPETPTLERPSWFWRSVSAGVITSVGLLSQAFLHGFNSTDVHGLDGFLQLLQSRMEEGRSRGLLTISNHISVMDEPLIWGVIPAAFTLQLGSNHRWSLGAHDICFNNAFSSIFFTLGQTLPVVRLAHNPNGGLFQPTMTEAIRLLSKIPDHAFERNPHHRQASSPSSSYLISCVDPFSETPISPAYSCFSSDRYFLAPSAYASNSYSWVHIFPEGMTHQRTDKTMRYFKWGVSRLILEPDECPDIVPMFIEGTDQVMHESRTFPRFIPRANKKIDVTFGDRVDTERVFGDLRRKWKELVQKERKLEGYSSRWDRGLGLLGEYTMYGDEAVALRIECTKRVREEVLKVRRTRGLPDEDPKAGIVDTWAKEGPKREGKMNDDSWIRDR